MTSTFIPNAFQIPNSYVDDFMAYLTPEEWKVLCYAARRIFGFNKRQDRISISQFVTGLISRDGTVLDNGTGLCRATIVNVLQSLTEIGLLIKVDDNDARANDGTLYSLQEDSGQVNLAKLQERQLSIKQVNQKRTAKAITVAHPSASEQDNKREVCGTDRTQYVRQTAPSMSDIHTIDSRYTEDKQYIDEISKNENPVLQDSLPLHIESPKQIMQCKEVIENKTPIKVPPSLDEQLYGDPNTPEGKFRRRTAQALANAKTYSDGLNTIDVSYFPEDTRDVIGTFCELWHFQPSQAKKAYWIKGAREVILSCGEYPPVDLLRSYRKAWEGRRKRNNGKASFDINGIGSIALALQGYAALIREKETIIERAVSNART